MPDKNDRDESLSQVLDTWTINTALPPRFEEQVWRSIARSEAEARSSLWGLVLGWLQPAMGRPVLAIAYLLTFLAVGAVAGYWQAEANSARVDQALGERYAQSIAPYTLAQR